MRAALGFRVHSGWAAVVAVADPLAVLDRRRVSCIDESVPGAKQPYHFVQEMELREAERHLARFAAASNRRAVDAVHLAVRNLFRRDFTITAAAVLDSAGRPLPDLAGILASHALIHTAEGDFFRAVFRNACESVGIRVTRIRERDLRTAPPGLRDAIKDLGRTLGPPWTEDQKLAAMAACMALSVQTAAGV